MFTAGGIPIGGVMQMPATLQGMPPHWIAYVGTPDVDATVREAEARGGQVHKAPMDIPEVGRFAVITDPQGATIAVFTPASEAPEAPGVPPRGHFSWHELVTTDHRAALEFYSALFGWEKISEFDMGPMGMYVLYGRNGQQLGGMFDKPADMPAPPHWLYYAHVDSADAAAARVKAAGGQVLHGPMDVPGGDRVAQCLDPQGGTFAVHSVK
jgi:predicted enzyme related to lactoylglutathione lyase